MSKLKLSLLIVVILFTGAGCVKFKTGAKDTSDIDGGVFKTVNKGGIWRQKSLIPSVSGRPGNFVGANVSSLFMDPSDHRAVYFGGNGYGLFYTYNGGETWQKAVGLGNATVGAVAVDPKSKCVIYAAVSNKVYKSSDCSRFWSTIYFDSEPAAVVKAIAVDHYNSSVVYIGIGRGDVIKSVDGGQNWRIIHNFKARIKDIVIDPNDSRVIYVLTEQRGVFRTTDGGGNWLDFNGGLKEFNLGFRTRGVVLVKNEPGIIFIATADGIIKSSDRGKTWKKINLIQPERKIPLNAVAVNPRNVKEIYYVTKTTFNRSLDGGETWTPSKLPTSRAGWKLLIDNQEPNIIYLGVKKF